MVKIGIDNNILTVNDSRGTTSFTTTDVRLYAFWNQPQPYIMNRTIILYNIYNNLPLTIFDSNTLDPTSDGYSDNMDEYADFLIENLIVSVPCMESLLFWLDYFDTYNNIAINQVEGGTNAIMTSNCVYFNGTSGKTEVTFVNDVLIYVDRIVIGYSTSGIIKQTFTTGNSTVSGLYKIDIPNKKLLVGTDGTNFFRGWIDRVQLQYYDGYEYIDIMDFTLSSGSNLYEYNRTINETEWVEQQYPFGNILDIYVSSNYKII